jgi:tetratricopeptide (TPR) repeat protein
MRRLDTLLQYHSEDPDDNFVRFAVASEYLKEGELAEALSWFEGLAADQPDYVGTYYHLGKLYERLGRTGDAIKTYEKGMAETARQKEFHAWAELESALSEARGNGEEDE